MTGGPGDDTANWMGQHVQAHDSATVHAPNQVMRDYIAVQHVHVGAPAGTGACARPGLASGAAALLEELLVGFDPPRVL